MNHIEFQQEMCSERPVRADSPVHQYMHKLAQQALQLTAELNGRYHTPEEVREIFSRIIGKEVDETFGLFSAFLYRLRKKHYGRQTGFHQHGL